MALGAAISAFLQRLFFFPSDFDSSYTQRRCDAVLLTRPSIRVSFYLDFATNQLNTGLLYTHKRRSSQSENNETITKERQKREKLLESKKKKKTTFPIKHGRLYYYTDREEALGENLSSSSSSIYPIFTLRVFFYFSLCVHFFLFLFLSSSRLIIDVAPSAERAGALVDYLLVRVGCWLLSPRPDHYVSFIIDFKNLIPPPSSSSSSFGALFSSFSQLSLSSFSFFSSYYLSVRPSLPNSFNYPLKPIGHGVSTTAFTASPESRRRKYPSTVLLSSPPSPRY